MQWQEVGIFNLTDRWQYSKQVSGNDFKVIYLSTSITARNSTGTIALADVPASGIIESNEFFRPQKISPYLVSEIVRFPVPPREWPYRLAFKQLTLPPQTISNLRIQIYMPAYSSVPAFNGSTSSVNSATIPVDNTKSVILSPASTGKIGTTITNISKVAKLYVNLGNAASLTNYDKILNNLEAYETPFNWSGEVHGIWDRADAAGNARVKDFS